MNIKRRFQDFFYEHFTLTHDIYGKIYLPRYNMSTSFDQSKPEYYNKNGELLFPVYLRDTLSSHSPYLKSDKVFFDRFNFGLDVHFYSQADLFQQSGKPLQKFALFTESETVIPESYEVFNRNKSLNADFDYIFTFSEKLLNSLPNAKFVPFCTAPWFGTEKYGGELRDDAFLLKTKNVSIMASKQNISDYHKFRIAVAKKCKQLNLADTYGSFDNGEYLDKIDHVFTPYRYSIIIENDEKPYYFTEKITSCFASMTIPIYLGATKIDSFFNSDGIIKITLSDLDNLETILASCSEQDYNSRLSAIKDNYKRVLKYYNTFDNFIYEPYINKSI